jgi:hypothetical protein
MNWSQLQALFWLRWRLTRNQWSRAGQVNAVITVLLTIVWLGIALAGGVAGVALGATFLAKAQPRHLMLVWDVLVGLFLLYWSIGVVTEIQRAESIDLSRLLHLPISLKQVFVLNYLASHLSFSLFFFLPAMLGLVMGLAVGKGWWMLGVGPVLLGFVFMVTAWTYCLRGWLISLMVNQRRRRTIIVIITMTFVLGGQLPNLYFNVMQRNWGHRHSKSHREPGAPRGSKQFYSASFMAAHRYVPPLWLGKSAMELARRNPWPALWGTLGLWGLGVLGLGRAYRGTLRFYRAEQRVKAAPAPRAAPAASAPRAPALLEREFPGIPEPAQALALASLRSLSRAPEVKMALAMNFIMLAVLGFMVFAGKLPAVTAEVKPFLAAGAVVATFFGLMQLLVNQFGMDRDAFRVLLLLPVRRRDILLGKNLALLPLALIAGLLFLGLLTIAIGLSPLVLLAAMLQLVAGFMLLSMLGNLASILAPCRVAAGSMKPTKAPAKTMLLMFAAHLVFPAVMTPILIPPALGWLLGRLGWLPAGVVNLGLSLVAAGMIGWIYWLSLEGLGRLLYQREKKILAVLTQEVE